MATEKTKDMNLVEFHMSKLYFIVRIDLKPLSFVLPDDLQRQSALDDLGEITPLITLADLLWYYWPIVFRKYTIM